MKPKELLRTIYIGDRACKSILIDGWRQRVCVQVDQISRIRNPNGEWGFYTDEDIDDGLIVFTDVRYLSLEPPGYLPNDYIMSVDIEDGTGSLIAGESGPLFTCTLSIGSVANLRPPHEVVVRVVACGMHIEDPNSPGAEITA